MKHNQAIISYVSNLSIKIYNICKNKIYIPSPCLLCDSFSNTYKIICENCYQLLNKLGHACAQCAQPLVSLSQEICSVCQQDSPAFNKVYTAFQYDELLKILIHSFKYHKGLYLTNFLTELMLEAPINQSELGLIVPTPLSKRRMRFRGYNQAAILAKSISKKINAPYADNYLQKIIDTPSQAAITGPQRHKNLKNAFKCNEIPYDTVTVIDDILTSGSTANEIAITLKSSGVKRVNIWCCARAKFN